MKRIITFVLWALPCLIPSAYSMWLSPDPLMDKYPNISPYAYCNWNPIRYVDFEGNEPVRAYVGTSSDFKTLLDNSTHKVGLYTGDMAANYMENVCGVEFKNFKVSPTQTGYFNNKKGRYIYTKKGGWVDMAHFMFYAGRAYKYHNEGVADPIGKTIQDGYLQEKMDVFSARHSAYSYEDLPSDYFGAIFGSAYFDANSNLTLGQQIKKFLDEQLQATTPQNAPNYTNLPSNDSKQKPSIQNKTIKPLFINEK